MDGTLLPMDQNEFTEYYMHLLGKTFAALGYDPEKLCRTVWDSFVVMLRNQSDQTNEQVFFDSFYKTYGEETHVLRPLFDRFYANEFQQVQKVCRTEPAAAAAVRQFQQMGLNVIVATLPAFPREAIYSRIRWAGLTPEDFSYITTYENSTRCKPNPAYYTEIVQKLRLVPEECLMVGNNVDEDMIAGTIGMQCFLMPECLINDHNKDTSIYPQGGFDDLTAYVAQLSPFSPVGWVGASACGSNDRRTHAPLP